MPIRAVDLVSLFVSLFPTLFTKNKGYRCQILMDRPLFEKTDSDDSNGESHARRKN